jgi:hypothetical protein
MTFNRFSGHKQADVISLEEEVRRPGRRRTQATEQLEEENCKLKQLVADLRLDNRDAVARALKNV